MRQRTRTPHNIYKHFYDKYDLLEYLFNQLTKDYFARDISDRLNHPFQTMSDTINNKEDLREIAEFQEEDAEFNKVLKNVCIKIMHNDIKNNETVSILTATSQIISYFIFMTR